MAQAAAIHQSATRLSALVDDLLKVAELEHHELRLEREPVLVSNLIVVSLRGFGVAAGDAGVRLESSIEDEVVVDADPLRLAQLFDNLISNAIKYTPAGGRVEVRAASDGDEVIIDVIDEGIGIDEADRVHVFDPFVRTRSGRDTAQGTGLGLSISRDIATAHGGTLTIHDTPGGGTTFRLRLPREPSSC